MMASKKSIPLEEYEREVWDRIADGVNERRGPHGEGYVPAGHAFEKRLDGQWYLSPLPGGRSRNEPLSERDRALAAALAKQLAALRASRRLPEIREAMALLRQALSPDLGSWDAMLVRLLESHAHRKTETRLRRHKGTHDPDSPDAQLRSAEAALTFLREHARPLPPRWLSARVIETMMDQVSLGGRGRARSKSAGSLVAHAQALHARGNAKKRTKSGK